MLSPLRLGGFQTCLLEASKAFGNAEGRKYPVSHALLMERVVAVLQAAVLAALRKLAP